MLRKVKRTALIGLIALSAGCTIVKPTYVEPRGVEKASLTVSIHGINIMNGQVLIHGPDICNANSAELAALVNNWDTLFTKISDATFYIPAGEDVTVSMPIQQLADANQHGNEVTSTYIYSQPVYTFTPVANENYYLDFYQQNAQLYVMKDGHKQAANLGGLDNTCQITSTQQGNIEKQFFLIPR